MSANNRLDRLVRSGHQQRLCGGLKGLEKESLRLSPEGRIAQTPHPAGLGSALTHPWITTDYSEALIELITPPSPRAEDTLAFLSDIHAFVQHHLEDEVLLATSMPIGLAGDESIPIARYGRSNIGMMKHIYRRGLAYRYGRTMQSIAGLHFNYSFNESLWPVLQDLEGDSSTQQAFVDAQYFRVIRNVHRYGWLLVYLFGNSPALCKSFFHGRESLTGRFARLDDETLYRPDATSLRMSDIGYRNDNQTSLDISFNALDEYTASLEHATNQSYAAYEAIGVKVDGEYRQLNANILQIENEYYSPVRPKQVARSGEKPTLALRKRGVRYLELRALDLCSFEPAGIALDTMRFLECFALFCLLSDSPPLSVEEKAECGQNSLHVACCGRGRDFALLRQGRQVPLRQWGEDILARMKEVAEVLDAQGGGAYVSSVDKVKPCLRDQDATPSARVLKTLRNNRESFAEFALRLSTEHAGHWRQHPVDAEKYRAFEQDARTSWDEQARIEDSDTMSLDDYLQRYWQQT